jgi:hypothetical protein
MAKIFNRGLLISGEKKKVGTPIITIVTLDGDNKVTRGYGASIPTDGDAGYAVGCIFAVTTGVVGSTLYINEGSTSSCDFNAVTSGAAGGVSTWNQLYANAKTMAITGTTVTFNGQHATNNVFTLTSTGAGSGNVLQITNVGTGLDVNGTSGLWSFSKLGAMTGLSVVLAGTAATTSFTMTLGNAVISAGGLGITKATDTNTLTVTNNASVATTQVAFAGSAAYTGNTTASYFTITPSGLTSGTAVYLPLAALTTGKGLHIVANAYSDGLVVNITSSSVASTSTGRLFNLAHTATANVNHIIAEMATAAQDETVLLKLTASDILAAGAILRVGGVAMTTGTAVDITDLAVLTTGIGVGLVSSATAITGAGRLLFVNHTGTTSSTGTLVEFKTAAADAANATTLLALTMAAAIVGVGLNVTSTTAMTTGSLIRASNSSAGAYATNGAISFTSTGNFTSTSAVNGGFVEVKANTTTAGTVVNVIGTSLTTGIALQLSNGTSAMTTGSLLRVTASGTGTVATNGIVSITHGGIFVSTSNAGVLDVRASAMVGTASNGTLVNFMTTAAAQVDTTVLNIENSGFTTGYTGSMLRIKSPTTTGAGILVSVIADGITSGGTAQKISTTALTTGVGLSITASGGTAAITTGSLLRVATDGTGAIATNGVVSFTHTGIYTSNSSVDGGFVEIKAASTTAGVLLNVVAAGLITGQAVSISNGTAATTTGSLLVVAAGGTGAVATNGIVSFTHTGVYTSTSAVNGGFVEIKAANTIAGTIVNIVGAGLTTGIALEVSNGTAATTTGSLIRGAAGGTGAVATNGIYSFFHTGVYTSTAASLGMFHISASATTAGTVASISGAAVIGGTILSLNATAATLTTGRYLSVNDLTAEVFGIGANGHLHSTVGAVAPTIVVTTQNGITAAAITAGGSDTCGVITTTGTNNNGGSTVLTVTFNKTYTTAPKAVFVTGANQAGQKASSTAGATLYGGAYVSSTTATTFVLTIPADSAASATPSFYYFVIA